MEGVGTPHLIIEPGATPHEYSLRPSDADALQEADIVFWVSPNLTPWLKGAIDALAEEAIVTELLEAKGTIELASRENALFEGHSDDAEDHGGDDHAEDDHIEEEEDMHGEFDTHAWLSPQNAANWLDLIADQLSAIDSDNAATYLENASVGRAEIEELSAEINAILEPVRGGRFIVFHDAYQYFEDAFDFPASGAISISDASDPSPTRIMEIRTRVADEGIDCVLAEPQFNSGLVATVMDSTEAKTGILDPLGTGMVPGSTLYPQLMRNLASTLSACL